MKFIVAIIKPFKFEDVRAALTEAGVTGLTVTEVSGYGRQKGQTEVYRGAEYTQNMLPKLKLEIAVSDDMADKVVETLMASAGSPAIGDGKIFVYELDEAIRIRTAEAGENAL